MTVDLCHSEPSCKKNVTRSPKYFAQKHQMDDTKVSKFLQDFKKQSDCLFMPLEREFDQ